MQPTRDQRPAKRHSARANSSSARPDFRLHNSRTGSMHSNGSLNSVNGAHGRTDPSSRPRHSRNHSDQNGLHQNCPSVTFFNDVQNFPPLPGSREPPSLMAVSNFRQDFRPTSTAQQRLPNFYFPTPRIPQSHQFFPDDPRRNFLQVLFVISYHEVTSLS